MDFLKTKNFIITRKNTPKLTKSHEKIPKNSQNLTKFPKSHKAPRRRHSGASDLRGFRKKIGDKYGILKKNRGQIGDFEKKNAKNMENAQKAFKYAL